VIKQIHRPITDRRSIPVVAIGRRNAFPRRKSYPGPPTLYIVTGPNWTPAPQTTVIGHQLCLTSAEPRRELNPHSTSQLHATRYCRVAYSITNIMVYGGVGIKTHTAPTLSNRTHNSPGHHARAGLPTSALGLTHALDWTIETSLMPACSIRLIHCSEQHSLRRQAALSHHDKMLQSAIDDQFCRLQGSPKLSVTSANCRF